MLRAVNGGSTPSNLPEFSETRFIVERAIEIISEASRRLDDDVKARHPAIAWRDMAIIGNHIRHGYDRVDERQLLAVVNDDLDPLEAVVTDELRRLDEG